MKTRAQELISDLEGWTRWEYLMMLLRVKGNAKV